MSHGTAKLLLSREQTQTTVSHGSAGASPSQVAFAAAPREGEAPAEPKTNASQPIPAARREPRPPKGGSQTSSSPRLGGSLALPKSMSPKKTAPEDRGPPMNCLLTFAENQPTFIAAPRICDVLGRIIRGSTSSPRCSVARMSLPLIDHGFSSL